MRSKVVNRRMKYLVDETEKLWHKYRKIWPKEVLDQIDEMLCHDEEVEPACHEFFEGKRFYPAYLIEHRIQEHYCKTPHAWSQGLQNSCHG